MSNYKTTSGEIYVICTYWKCPFCFNGNRCGHQGYLNDECECVCIEEKTDD